MAVLKSIVITPVLGGITTGNTRQLIATGYYSDGSSKNLSPSVVSWKSLVPSVATVSNNGLVTGTNTGIAIISAETPSILGFTVMVIVNSQQGQITLLDI